MNRVFFFVIASAVLLAPAWCQSKSVMVSGTVYDSTGKQEAGAAVTAFPLSGSAVAGNLSWLSADDKGRFRIVLEPGRYVIRAKHEEAGSSDPNALLSRDPRNHFPVVVAGDSDITGIEVRLAPKGGIVEGIVIDESTGSPITGGQVTIVDARNFRGLVRLGTDHSGHFQLALPNKPVVISATAPGYSVTQFQGGKELTLAGGEHQSITIVMARPKSK